MPENNIMRHEGLVKLEKRRMVIGLSPADAAAHGIATEALRAARSALRADTAARIQVRGGAIFAELECEDTKTAGHAAQTMLKSMRCTLVDRPTWDSAEALPK